MARCDPSPPGVSKSLQSNEYPITCFNNNPGEEEDVINRQEYTKMLDLFSENRKDVEQCREEMAELRKGMILCTRVRPEWVQLTPFIT